MRRPDGPGRDSAGMGRREFLRLSACGLTVIGLPVGCLREDEGTPAADHLASGRPVSPQFSDARTPVLWVEAGTCTGCACSLLGSRLPPVEVLLPDVRLEFQETLMERFGAPAVDHLLSLAGAAAGRFVLVVDGAIPVGAGASLTTLGVDGRGRDYTAAELVTQLADRAARVVALGTCAAFGGIPSSGAGAGMYVSVAEATGRMPLRVPGCPPNPQWISAALGALLRGEALELDELGRPMAFFSSTVHELCPRLGSFRNRDFATAPGDAVRCLRQVGCKGQLARGDCPIRLWQGRSSCVKAGSPCVACTAPGFPDARPTVDGRAVGEEGKAASPFLRPLPL